MKKKSKVKSVSSDDLASKVGDAVYAIMDEDPKIKFGDGKKIFNIIRDYFAAQELVDVLDETFTDILAQGIKAQTNASEWWTKNTLGKIPAFKKLVDWTNQFARSAQKYVWPKSFAAAKLEDYKPIHNLKYRANTKNDSKDVKPNASIKPTTDSSNQGYDPSELGKPQRSQRNPRKEAQDERNKYTGGIITVKTNHPQWYTKNGDTTTNLQWDTTNWSRQNGNSIIASGAYIPYTMTVPGTLTNTTATGGAIEVDCTAFKTSMNAAYMKLCGSNVSVVPFTADDLSQYVMASASIRALYNAMARGIKALNTFEFEDALTPLPTLGKLGFNFSTQLEATGAKGRAELIDCARVIRQRIAECVFTLPDLAYNERIDLLTTNMFRCGKNDYKDIEVSFVPEYVFHVIEAPTEVKFIDPQKVEGTSLTSLQNQLLEHIDAFLSNQLVATIGTYLLRAYGDRAFQQLELVNLDSRIVSVYDEDMLDQINNAIIWNQASKRYQYDPVNHKGTLSGYAITGTSNGVTKAYAGNRNVLVRTGRTVVSSGKAMSLTALNPGVFANTTATGVYSIRPYAIGTEIVNTPVIIYMDGFGYKTHSLAKYWVVGESETVSPTDTAITLQVPVLPKMRVMSPNIQSSDNWYIDGNELKVFAPYSIQNAELFNDTRTLSMFKTIDIRSQDNFKAHGQSKSNLKKDSRK